MSKKRKGGAGDQLTGGTGDVNPQFMSAHVAQTVANTFVQTSIAIPLDRFKANGGKVGAIEILKVFFFMNEVTPATVANNQYYQAWITTTPFTTAPTNYDPHVVATWTETQQFVTSGGTAISSPDIVDVTDGAGHGVIIAVDTIYFSFFTQSTGGMNGTCSVRIMYRFKNIGLPEYIGIVQSQNQ